MFTLTQCLSDEGEVHECAEHHIQLVEPGEDPAEALASTKQPFDLVAAVVECLVEAPRMPSTIQGWNDGTESQVQRELTSVVALVRTVHDEGNPKLEWGF